jgi:Holliday junction resolvase RusA-like endonuclease
MSSNREEAVPAGASGPLVLFTHLVIPGQIHPKGSMRSFGPGRMVENSKLGVAWRKNAIPHIKDAASRIPSGWIEQERGIVITASYVVNQFKTVQREWPWSRKHGDVDKYDRNLHDALEQGGLLTDDAKIVSHYSHKRFARDDEPAHTYVEIAHGTDFDIPEYIKTFITRQL